VKQENRRGWPPGRWTASMPGGRATSIGVFLFSESTAPLAGVPGYVDWAGVWSAFPRTLESAGLQGGGAGRVDAAAHQDARGVSPDLRVRPRHDPGM